MSPPLAVVSELSDSRLAEGQPTAALADRIRRLQAEAQGLAREHIGALQSALVAVERLSAEIAAGGEAYPVGVRDIARRLADDCGAKVQTIATLVTRN